MRIKSIDSIRVVAAFAVIVIHAKPFSGTLLFFTDQACRFAVITFFILAGYFWKPDKTYAQTKRLMFLYVAWCFIYLTPYNIAAIAEFGWLGPLKIAYWHAEKINEDGLLLIFKGTQFHLWFIPSLICAMWIANLLWGWSLAAVSVLLYCVALSKTYGFADAEFRYGPHFSLLPFVTGHFLATVDTRRPSSKIGVALIIIGSLLHALECRISPLELIEYSIGLYLISVGLVVCAIHHDAEVTHKLAIYGKYTLGIYLVHFVFIDNFSTMNMNPAASVIVVFFASTIVSATLHKTKIRWLVS